MVKIRQKQKRKQKKTIGNGREQCEYKSSLAATVPKVSYVFIYEVFPHVPFSGAIKCEGDFHTRGRFFNYSYKKTDARFLKPARK